MLRLLGRGPGNLEGIMSEDSEVGGKNVQRGTYLRNRISVLLPACIGDELDVHRA